MIFEVSFWLLAGIGVFITGVSKSGFAGGIGVIAVPLLATEIEPVRAVAIMLPLLLIMDYFSVRAWWGKQIRAHLNILLPASFFGILIGYLLFDYLDDALLRILLGVFSILFAIWGFTSSLELDRLKGPVAGNICGFIAGVTSFFAHAGGPPLNFYLLPQKMPREAYLATAVICLASINLVKVIPYAQLGQINLDNLLIDLLLVPIAWLGIKTGILIQGKINDRIFYRVILFFLALVGVKLIFDAYCATC